MLWFLLQDMVGQVESLDEAPVASAGGSRFSQWFQDVQQQVAQSGGSRENSRRSSINEEFGNFSYLNGK